MSRSLQLESSPRWYQIPHGISLVFWFIFVLAGAVQLYRQLTLASSLPSVYGIGYKVGSIATFLGFVVCLIFTSRVAAALKKSSPGPLRIASMGNSTRILAILSCAGSLTTAGFMILAWKDGNLIEDNESVHLGFTIVTAVVTVWILFLTVRVAFGKVQDSPV